MQRWMDAWASALFEPAGEAVFDFSEPKGEPALVAPDSVSWRIFKNPVSLFIGGVAAVILELAEPAVRTGVWEHSSFRDDPVRRLQRTGRAAMITVYAGQGQAEAMIARVVKMHERVAGTTPSGESYRANDPALLTWVHVTAGFGFAEAYHRFVRPLTPAQRDAVHREGLPAALRYGAVGAPADEAGRVALFEAMRGRLESSPVVFEFLSIMREAPALPPPLRPVQRLLVRAAVEITPGWVRHRLGLTDAFGLRPWEISLVRQVTGLSDRIMLRTSPAVQSCLRLGVPADYLYRR